MPDRLAKASVQIGPLIATHLSQAAEKLRLYRLTVNVLQVFAHTSRYRDNYYSNGVTISLPVATQDTRELLDLLREWQHRMFKTLEIRSEN